MVKKVPVRCMRCGEDYDEMELPDDIPGNVVWGYCPTCRDKAEKPLAEFAAKNTLEAVVKRQLRRTSTPCSKPTSVSETKNSRKSRNGSETWTTG